MNVRYRVGALWLMLVCLSGAGVAAEKADVRNRVRDWAIAELQRNLVAGADLNVVSSLITPMVSDVQRNAYAPAREVLARTRDYLAGLDPERMGCKDLTDFYISAGYLGRVDLQLATGDSEARLRECMQTGTPFDLANSLVFACHHATWNHIEALPGAMDQLRAYQRADGFFVNAGKPHFYLTSHAMLALHWCGEDPDAVQRAALAMRSKLPNIRKMGFNDGLIEVLIFLDWLGIDVAERAGHLAYLQGQVDEHGGICFMAKPDCDPHWHPVSLMYELLL